MELRKLEKEFIIDSIKAAKNIMGRLVESDDNNLDDPAWQYLDDDNVLECNLYDYQYKHGAITHEEWLAYYENQELWYKEKIGYEVVIDILDKNLLESEECYE